MAGERHGRGPTTWQIDVDDDDDDDDDLRLNETEKFIFLLALTTYVFWSVTYGFIMDNNVSNDSLLIRK
jgi:hypothetical protein